MGFIVDELSQVTKKSRMGIILPELLNFITKQEKGKEFGNGDLTAHLMEKFLLGPEEKSVVSRTISECSHHPTALEYTHPGDVIKLYGRMVGTRVWVNPA